MKYIILFFALVCTSYSYSQTATDPKAAPTPPTPPVKAFTSAECMPEYADGPAAMMKFIRENTVYPEKELADRTDGIVILTFIVAEDGSRSDIKVKKSLTPALDKEAIRIVNAMPKFRPGMQGGKPVKVSLVLPVRFSVNEYKKAKK